VRLFVDASGRVPFSGSCSVVSHLLRRGLEGAGFGCEETLIAPQRLDAAGTVVPAEPLVLPASGADRLLFFEEVFLRTRFERSADRAQACVFFNLLCFGDRDIGRFANVATLLFNSEFLARVFLAFATDPTAPERVEGFRATHVAACPLALPQIEFESGYPSHGATFPPAELARLATHHVLGHALRPGLDPVAAVAIVHALARLVPDRPPRLFVLQSQWPELMEVAAELRVADPSSLFEPVARLNNPSLLAVMQSSDFALAYDRSIEAFGFYALESVWCRTPVYTNGAGNLRHLLPPGHGIECHENAAMAFGEGRERLDAYAPVAERIASDLKSRSVQRRCELGRAELLRRYTPDRFARAVLAALRAGQPNVPRATAAEGVVLHPLVRLCDLESGRIVTDEAAVELDEAARRLLRSALRGELRPDREALAPLFHHHVLTPRLAGEPGATIPSA
jgi:hypothetical protein